MPEQSGTSVILSRAALPAVRTPAFRPSPHPQPPRREPSVERIRHIRLQAAVRGDRAAFAAICEELAAPLARVTRRSLLEAKTDVSDDDVRRLMLRVFTVAFDEIGDKPRDWSVYGWMSWLVVREIACRSD